MTTTTLIAKAAFDAVSSQITDAIKDATLNDGATDYEGRVVFTAEKAAGGFPMSTAKDRVNEAVLEGFGVVPSAGWTITAGGVLYFIIGTRNIVEAGGVVMARVIAEADMLWQSVTFTRNGRVSDGFGGWTDGDTTVGTTTGGIVALSGSERWASMRVEATAKWRLIVRDTGLGLLASDRVTINGRSYGISFIDDHEMRGEWLSLDLVEGVAT
jgi:head-tail adaptor